MRKKNKTKKECDTLVDAEPVAMEGDSWGVTKMWVPSKGERAVIALREAADALDQIPVRRVSILGQQYVSTASMRDEANWIESQMKQWRTVMEDSNG
jgi:hypothetical protein